MPVPIQTRVFAPYAATAAGMSGCSASNPSRDEATRTLRGAFMKLCHSSEALAKYVYSSSEASHSAAFHFAEKLRRQSKLMTCCAKMPIALRHWSKLRWMPGLNW